MFGGKWEVEQPHELRLTPTGRPYATLSGVTVAKVTITGAVHALLVTPTVRLSGYVDPKALQLHPSRPFLAGGFLAPSPTFVIQLVEFASGKLSVEFPFPDAIRGEPLRELHACSDFTIEPRPFEARAAIGGKNLRTAYLTENVPIPLSTQPGGAPIVRLQYETGLGPTIEILEQSERNVRVVVLYNSLDPAHDAVLVGWVPVETIHHEAHGSGGSWASDGASGTPRARPSKNPRVTCSTEVPLDVEFEGQRKTVGVVMPDVEIELAGGDEVILVSANVALDEGARWLIAKPALASCTTK